MEKKTNMDNDDSIFHSGKRSQETLWILFESKTVNIVEYDSIFNTATKVYNNLNQDLVLLWTRFKKRHFTAQNQLYKKCVFSQKILLISCYAMNFFVNIYIMS
jgi:hypothetical protein